MFKDRDDAAHQLADRLKGYRDQHPLVLAIPRGAVPIGKIVARQIGGDFESFTDSISYSILPQALKLVDFRHMIH